MEIRTTDHLKHEIYRLLREKNFVTALDGLSADEIAGVVHGYLLQHDIVVHDIVVQTLPAKYECRYQLDYVS
jgi:hypothetical protein